MIVERAEGPVEAVELRGIESARPTPEALTVLAEADAIVIGPSNPVISIGPILALPGMCEALRGVAGAGGRGQPVRRRPRGEGTDGDVLRLRRDRAAAPPGSPVPTTGCSTGSWPTSRWTGCRRSSPTP